MNDQEAKLAEALNIFRSQHDDERFWTAEEIRWHDLLLSRIMFDPKKRDECDRP